LDPAAAYFQAEQLESLLFLAVGVIALAASAGLWWGRRSPQARGCAVALAAVAAIQVTVGATIYARTPGDLARVQAQMQGDRARILSDEVPRMRTVMRNFEIYRWIEIALLGGGALLV
jgi:membrane protein implicated in regulation of membrane protease activity